MKKAAVIGIYFVVLAILPLAAQQTWNCGSFSVTCNDTIVNNCVPGTVCSSSVLITNNDNTNSLTCLQVLNSIDNSPSGWLYNLCNLNGCQPIGVYSSTFVIPPLSTKAADFQAHLNSNSGTAILNVSFKDNNNTAAGTSFKIYIGDVTTVVKEEANDVFLSQNFPNPSTGSTSIKYKLDSNKGQLVIMNMLGKKVMEYSLENNSGDLMVKEKLQAGVYFYALYSNGRIIANKKMIVQ